MSTIPIFQQDGFRIGIGDSNNDGKLDFDFGIRSETYGNSPWGSGHSGFEIGLNTDRGAYVGGDYSNHNMWGSSGGGGRVFADGGHQSGNWSNDIFGNHHQNYESAGPFHYTNSSHGGNFYNGNYYGHRTDANPFEMAHSNYGGNHWTGAHQSNHSYGNIFGQGGSFSVGTPPFVPSYGHGHHMGCGCCCAGQFMGW